MLSVHDKTWDYCEVCNYELQKTVAEYLQQPLFYIGDPQLTKKRDYSYDSYYYSTQNLLQNEIYDFNINWVKNSQLELRTVVSNLTNSTRKIKLRIRIQKTDGTYSISNESNEEIIKPKDIKNLCLYSQTINEADLQDFKSVIGEVIDVETNQILATSLDRQNRILKYNNKLANTGKELHTIKINFVDKDSKRIYIFNDNQLTDINAAAACYVEFYNHSVEALLMQRENEQKKEFERSQNLSFR